MTESEIIRLGFWWHLRHPRTKTEVVNLMRPIVPKIKQVNPQEQCPDGRSHKWSEGWITFCLHCSVLKEDARKAENPNEWKWVPGVRMEIGVERNHTNTRKP